MPPRLDALITPSVLRWARESINMDAHDAAARIGVVTSTLADWEDGIERPTIPQVRRVAQVYRRPLAFFYLAVPPRTFHSPHDFRRLPLFQKDVYSPELHLELRRAHFQRETAVALADADAAAWPIASLAGTVTHRANPAAVARDLRERLGVTLAAQAAWQSDYDALNAWKNAVERLGVLVFHFERVAVTEARGFSIADLPLPVVALNGADAPRGRAFTLLHELAHVLLKHGGVCDVEARRRPDDSDGSVEAFCNQVAGEVLVPAAALLAHPLVAAHAAGAAWEDAALGAVASAFQVSREVALIRLMLTGRVTRAFYERWRQDQTPPRPRKTGQMAFSQRVLRRVGQPYARLVIGAYHDERITGSDLAEYLGAPLRHLSRIEERLQGRNLLTGGDR